MSYRLYVHKKHVVTYGESSFNHDTAEVNEILFTLCDEYHGNREYFADDDEIEIPKESFKKMLDMDIKEVRKRLKENEVRLPEDYTLEEVMESFKVLYDDADPDNYYINLSWA